MKKIFVISGILWLLLTIGVMIIKPDWQSRFYKAIHLGNEMLITKNYEASRRAYEDGIGINPKKNQVYYNLGLSEYLEEDYTGAVDYYAKAPDTYLEMGNAYYHEGVKAPEQDARLKAYKEALRVYLNGIKADSTDLELKYNYETVQKLIQDIEDEQQKNNGEESENEQNGEDQNQGGQGVEDPNQNQGGQNGEGQNQGGQNGNEDTDIQSLSPEMLDQILKILEQQEEESLKNNQDMIRGYEEDYYDW